jgi:cation:H+ antiporter
MNDYVMFVGGVLLAGAGGELFVRGAVGIGRAARIAPGVVAATIAAFATSSPEFTVSVAGALEGKPSLGLGDTLGSNIVNIALILGLSLFWGPFHPPRDSIRRDFPVALAAPALTAVLLFDNELSRWDGLALLAVFAAWLTAVFREVRKQRSAVEEVLGERKPGRALAESVGGLVLLIAASRLMVAAASSIAQSYGVSPFVIGATIVAIGTSVPELATTAIARVRGHDEVGLGTILGSNIFNGVFVVGVVACITPINVRLTSVAPVLTLGIISTALTFPGRSGIIDWRRGLLLVSLYVAHIAAMAQSQ